MRRLVGVALAFGLLAFGVTSLGAEVADPADGPAAAVNVTNTYWAPVHVYAEDAEGGLHFLGRVARDTFELFEVPTWIIERGDYRIKVYPYETDARPGRSINGVKTRPLSPETDQDVVLWLTEELEASVLMSDQG